MRRRRLLARAQAVWAQAVWAQPACAAFALLALLALTASGLAFPQAAGAATASGDITIVSVAPPPPAAAGQPPVNQGLMTVTTESGSQITAGSLTVHLFTGKKDVLDVSDFTQIAGSQTSPEEIWQVENPITPSQLGPGTYRAAVDAGDTAGTQQGLAGGNFQFLNQPALTLSASPATISYNHPDVVFSGDATEVAAGSTTAAPYTGQRIPIIGPITPANPSGEYEATTDSAGHYRLTVAPGPGDYYAALPASTTTASAQSAVVSVTASPVPVRLAIKFARPAIQYGQTDLLTGTLRYQSAGRLEPLARATVTITRISPSGEKKITEVTTSAGAFRASIPRQTVTGVWTATAGGTSLLGKAAVTRKLTVRQTTGFRHVSIDLGAFGALSVRACLVDTSAGQAKDPLSVPVTLEYARSATGRWTPLVTIEPSFGDDHCPVGALDWTIRVNAPAHNAYYRLRFAGAASLRLSVSKTVHLWRDPTRITSFGVSPRQVHAKGAITISGRLWRQVATRHGLSWQPYGGRKVPILFQYHGVLYVFTTRPTTDSRGYFSGLFTAYVTAKWMAQYDGDKTHFGSDSPGIKVTVTGGSARLISAGHGVERTYLRVSR